LNWSKSIRGETKEPKTFDYEQGRKKKRALARSRANEKGVDGLCALEHGTTTCFKQSGFFPRKKTVVVVKGKEGRFPPSARKTHDLSTLGRKPKFSAPEKRSRLSGKEKGRFPKGKPRHQRKRSRTSKKKKHWPPKTVETGEKEKNGQSCQETKNI